MFQIAYAIANRPPPNCHKAAIKSKTVPVAFRSRSIIADPSAWVGSERVYNGGEDRRGERGVDHKGIQQVGHFKLPYQS